MYINVIDVHSYFIMANLQIRIDDYIRDRAQEVASSMGLDLASSVRMFLYQMVRENGLPFQPKADPFYSASNMAHLKQVVDDLNAGKNLVQHELIED